MELPGIELGPQTSLTCEYMRLWRSKVRESDARDLRICREMLMASTRPAMACRGAALRGFARHPSLSCEVTVREPASDYLGLRCVPFEITEAVLQVRQRGGLEAVVRFAVSAALLLLGKSTQVNLGDIHRFCPVFVSVTIDRDTPLVRTDAKGQSI